MRVSMRFSFSSFFFFLLISFTCFSLVLLLLFLYCETWWIENKLAEDSEWWTNRKRKGSKYTMKSKKIEIGFGLRVSMVFVLHFSAVHTHTHTHDLYQDFYAANISASHFRISAAIKPFMAYSICINGIVPQYLRHGLCNSVLWAPFFPSMSITKRYVAHFFSCWTHFIFPRTLSPSRSLCVYRSLFLFFLCTTTKWHLVSLLWQTLLFHHCSSFNPDYLVGCLNVRY